MRRPSVTDRTLRRLMTAALGVRQRAYAPYSGFAVGAALLGDDGKIYAGCNVENSAYPLSLCAERNAIGQAIARGSRRVLAAAIVTGSRLPSPPCGMCLQAFAEFADGTLPILLSSVNGAEVRYTLDELLPHRFDRAQLPKTRRRSS